MKEQDHRSTEWMTRKWAAALALGTLPIFVLFIVLLDEPGTGFVAWMAAASIVGVVRHLWDLKAYVWFWVTLAMIVAAQVLLIRWIPWPQTKTSSFGLLIVGFLHVLLVRGTFGLVERIMMRIGTR